MIMPKLLDGKKIAAQIMESVSKTVVSLPSRPVLAIVLATTNESTLAYVNKIRKTAEKAGIEARLVNLTENTDSGAFLERIKKLAKDTATHGIIIQTPLKHDIDIDGARELIPLAKDIDGASPLSAGRLGGGLDAFAPATAQAVIEILNGYDIDPAGKHAVVVGRSRIIGKPVAGLLVERDATVTVCHSKTENLAFYTESADVLVVAAGKAHLITKQHIDAAKGTVIIDVGTNFVNDRMVGDVDFIELENVAGAITPVPGGVGPVTVAVLLRNTLDAYLKQHSDS
ncbi:MAG TPA: bifunctional 5,10-methylenetetrahydrofolate dehydrogenase/5,10-methenyltetrahydrofolate cyclohydrolase [Candidatus Saccharimonadales bacterium]|nr:bifunctional 5,10-methylenetetrahydrofolate dehydrogenase/5,10-methenyltetrahydrofolate cyclohydrolase [Candidatus Saccharimonadales bacterium]